MKGFPLELDTAAGDQKSRMIGPPSRERSFDDIFSLLGTIYQRVRWTGGQTPGDSKERTYACVAR